MSGSMLLPPRRLVTLTTDFGTRDPYVAEMKGVLRRFCTSLQIEDLTHEIAPQQVTEAALFIEQSAPAFPPGTIHLVVVDPGVGTERRALAVYAGEQYFVCPDNGVLSCFLARCSAFVAHEITDPRYRLASVSATFHGRDVFAPAAARLASGFPLHAVGPRVNDPVALSLPAPACIDGRILGEVIHVDRFGNCITNIHRGLLDAGRQYRVVAGTCEVSGISPAYGSVDMHEALALFGGSGRLEIAVRNGNASTELRLGVASLVVLNPS